MIEVRDFPPILMPKGLHVEGRAHLLSDLHGCAGFFSFALRDILKDILACDEPCRLGILGDLTNRGPGSMANIRLMNEVKTQALPKLPHLELISVMGNHCELVARAIGHPGFTGDEKASQTALSRCGGDWILDMLRDEDISPGTHERDMNLVRDWIDDLEPFHIGKWGKGKILLTHAAPEPVAKIETLSDRHLRWVDLGKRYKSREILVGGGACLNIHGHVSREYRRLSDEDVYRMAAQTIEREGRLNIDGGLPKDQRLIRAELRGREIRLRFYRHE